MDILDEVIEIHGEASPDEADWEVFIGPNAAYYLPIFRTFKQQDKVLSFNFSAIFMNIYWMAYRKMYRNAVLVLGLSNVLLIGLVVMGVEWNLAMASNLLIYAAYCFGGNWMYYKHVEAKITAIKQQGLSPIETQNAIAKEGGTNPLAPLLVIFISFFITGILVFLGVGLVDTIGTRIN